MRQLAKEKQALDRLRALQTLQALQAMRALQALQAMQSNHAAHVGDNYWASRFAAGNSNADNTQGYVYIPGTGSVSYGF